GTYAHFLTFALPRQSLEEFLASLQANWGTGASAKAFAPRAAENDPRFRTWWARFERLGASPSGVMDLMRMNSEIDVRNVLPAIRVPTLVLHRMEDSRVPVLSARYLAQHIPGAKLVEVPGVDHAPWTGDVDRTIDEIEEFLTGSRPPPETNRVLATVLFTDIVDSTKRAAEVGDRAWRELIGHHHFLVRQQLERHRGREI